MVERSLADWLSRLEQLHPSEIDLGLKRVHAVAERLQLLRPSARVVTVAGTNGKGSTIAVLESLLLKAGLSTGVYTSPHLLKFNERVCVDGNMVSDEALVASFEKIDAARGDISLTYFEFATLAALDIFAADAPDVLLLEVGLGGRLDAINIIDADIAIITSIALDHESWLGTDREQIALEKAGVLRPGCHFICADLTPCQSLQQRALELDCVSHYVSAEEAQELSIATPLRGENIAAARYASQLLGVAFDIEQTRHCVAGLKLRGRLQSMQLGGTECLVDVAHNPASVENLARVLMEKPVSGRTIAVFAALSDKNIHAMILPVQHCIDAWFIADLAQVSRGASAAELAEVIRSTGANMISESDNPRQAYRRARSVTGDGDRIVVFGSFYTVAAVLPGIEKDLKKLE